MKKLLKERSNKMQNDSDTIYWDSENNVHMQYSPIWERIIPKKISVWDIDKPEYQPENLPNYQEYLSRNYKSSLSETEQNSVKPPFKQQHTPLHKRTFYDNINPITPNNRLNIKNPGVTPHKHGVMINDYSEPVDTIKLAKESPHLDRITDFSKSKSVSKKMWGNLIDGVNYLDQNEYGKKILENIPNKSLHFNHTKSLNVPGQINKNEKSITFSDESPQLSQQSEELIHAAQFNKYYGGEGKGHQNIPGINLEIESKILQDIIAAKNYLKTDDSDNLKYIGSKFFIEGSFSKEENFKLGKKYFDIIMDIATTDSINKKDLKFLNSISSKTSKEKSNHDYRGFNEAIEPKLIKSLFPIKE